MASDENEPDVSVVIPAWGEYAGRRLDEAIASIQAQDLACRVLVVDNASEPPVARADGVEIVRSPDRLTVGAARNLGLAAVRTPYVIFWDADDLMLPGTVRFLRERIAADAGVVLVAASIQEGDPPVPHRWPRRWSYSLSRRPRVFALVDSVWSLFPTTGSSIIRSDAARAAGFADANSGEDWVLGVSLAFRGQIVLERRPGRLYRRHAQSLWQTQRSFRRLLAHAKAVRERMRADPAIPSWATAAIPLVACLQMLATCVLHPLAETAKAVRPRGRSVS